MDKKNDHVKIKVYIDVYYAMSTNDRQSIYGFYTHAGGNLVT